VSHARNGGAVPRSRAMHRSVCRRRRVNLLERCCERTRTDRRRTLCERRRLRYAAAILLRQGGEIAPAPWRSRPDPSDVGALRRSFRRDHREPRHRATLSPTGGNEQAGRDEPLTPVSLLAIPFSRRCSSVRGPRRGAFSDDAFAPSFQGAATLSEIQLAPRAGFRESGNRPRSAFEQCPRPLSPSKRSSDRFLPSPMRLGSNAKYPFLFPVISPTPAFLVKLGELRRSRFFQTTLRARTGAFQLSQLCATNYRDENSHGETRFRPVMEERRRARISPSL